MKNLTKICFLFLLLSISCGKDSPFDEDYWDTPSFEQRDEQVSTDRTFIANITPLNGNSSGNINGSVNILINQTEVITTLELNELPQSLMLGQRSLSNQSCADIALNFPPPIIITNTTEFKTINLSDSGSRESLIADLNQTDPQNGDSTNLTNKSYVIKAYIEIATPPNPQAAALIPVACGTLVLANEQDEDPDGTPNPTPSATPGTDPTPIPSATPTSVSTGGTAGGLTTGTTMGGSVGGTSGGVTGD